ncbi:MAG TPA: hypothetical protein VNM87_06965 [Candidatus Udaeobacter sp.]|nr:hypothetical protein [Candidatus Udaeobacter sp.]
MTSAPSDRGRAVSMLVLVSFLLLTLELAQVRLFSYSLFPAVVYVAIAVTLLGLGASGTALALWPRLAAAEPRVLIARALLAAGITVPVAHYVFAELCTPRKAASLGEYPLLVPLLIGLAAPQFLFGLVIARLLSAPPATIPRRYGANLLGSALACLAFGFLLPRLGLERVIVAVGLGAALGALWAARGRARLAAVVTAVALCPLLVAAPRVLDFPPRYGQLERLLDLLAHAPAGAGGQRLAAQREYSFWDPVGRIEIHSVGDDRIFLPTPVESRFYSQDASNGSILIAFPPDSAESAPFFTGTVYGSAYFQSPPESVLVIGLGGGPDIFTALNFRARSVTGVEINQGAIDAVLGPMADFLGDPYRDPRVHVVCADGRGFLRRNTVRYDVIQLSGVDTGTALSPGSNVLAENYLYTREAIADLLQALEPEHGVLSILRFGEDALRLSLLASGVLRELGEPEPGMHLVVVGQGFWQNLLLKRTPFTREELAALDRHLRAGAVLPRVRIPTYEYLGFGLEQPLTYIYHPLKQQPSYMADFWTQVRAGHEGEIFARMPRLLRSVTDDRPYFFFNFFGELRPLLLFLLEIAVMSGILIFLPFVAARRARPGTLPAPAALRLPVVLGFFAALGAGYLLIEVALMQRFVLFLGHPSYSISVTLASLLLGSGLGALAEPRMPKLARAAPLAIAAATLLLVLDFHRPLLAAAEQLPLPARMLTASWLVLPLGFLMGMPFPSALRRLGAAGIGLIPWAIGVNGFASVVAAVGNLPLSMIWGFRVALLCGGGCYLVAAALRALAGWPASTPADEAMSPAVAPREW